MFRGGVASRICAGEREPSASFQSQGDPEGQGNNVSTIPAPDHLAMPQDLLLQPESPDQEALIRLRLAAAVSLLAELILPVFEASAYSKPDWLAIEAQAIWFVLTVALLAAT